jgi:hypothetical protein
MNKNSEAVSPLLNGDTAFFLLVTLVTKLFYNFHKL